jgi:hypothetical protein
MGQATFLRKEKGVRNHFAARGGPVSSAPSSPYFLRQRSSIVYDVMDTPTIVA